MTKKKQTEPSSVARLVHLNIAWCPECGDAWLFTRHRLLRCVGGCHWFIRARLPCGSTAFRRLSSTVWLDYATELLRVLNGT